MDTFARSARFLASTFVALAVLLAGGGSAANAATLNVVGGQLLGASNVDVGGSLFDVEFLDGRCINLFNGCDSAADFAFTTNIAASLASQALLDQVFLDGGGGLFDSQTALTAGCTNVENCSALTPYFVSAGSLDTVAAHNIGGLQTDLTGSFATGSATDYGSSASGVFAVWTPVPEPNTALLLSLGLIGLAAKRKKSLG